MNGFKKEISYVFLETYYLPYNIKLLHTFIRRKRCLHGFIHISPVPEQRATSKNVFVLFFFVFVDFRIRKCSIFIFAIFLSKSFKANIKFSSIHVWATKNFLLHPSMKEKRVSLMWFLFPCFSVLPVVSLEEEVRRVDQIAKVNKTLNKMLLYLFVCLLLRWQHLLLCTQNSFLATPSNFWADGRRYY